MIHHVVPVGHGRGKSEILFHQQHGEAATLDLADGAADLAARSPAPAPRSGSSSSSKPGPRCAGCARSQHLLLAARQPRAVRRARALLQIGKQREDRSRCRSPPCAPPAAATVLHHVERSRRCLSPPGEGNAGRASGWASARRSGVANRMLPSRRGTRPMTDFSVVACGTVAAEQRHHSPYRTSKSTPCRMWLFADPGVQALNVKHMRPQASATPR